MYNYILDFFESYKKRERIAERIVEAIAEAIRPEIVKEDPINHE